MAEVFAGFVSHTDDQLGRVLDYLEETGQLDNTLVVVVSDNGAWGEGGPNGSFNESRFFNGVPDTTGVLKLLDELGGAVEQPLSDRLGVGVRHPVPDWKRCAGYEGGAADPLIVSWPNGITAKSQLRGQYTHAVDIVPTLLECLGLELPES